MNRPRSLLPEAEYLQLHPDDYRHPRNRPSRRRRGMRDLATVAGILFVVAVLIVCLVTWHDFLTAALTSHSVWEMRDWPVAP
jgi:uncharacterized membrane protein